MGAVDLVIQVESPKSVARGLQRIGRAGHELGAVSKGRIFPKFRGDLLESAVVVAAHARGRDRGDRDPAQPARRARAADRRDLPPRRRSPSTTCTSSCAAPIRSPTSRATSSRTCSTCSPAAIPSDEFAELRPRIVWDRTAGVVRGRDGARRLAVTNAGTIPDRGLFGVHLVDGGGRVGELDEEMVYEARAGQTFLLGASTWRIEEITRDRVLVSPAPGRPGRGAVLEGRGRRPAVRARRGDRRSRRASSSRSPTTKALDAAARRAPPRRARGREPAHLPARAGGRDRRRAVRPHRSSSSASATRSATGASASSRRSARACTRRGRWRSRRACASRSGSRRRRSGRTTGSRSTCPTPTRRRRSTTCMLDPDEVEELVVSELGQTRALRRALPRERRPRAADPAPPARPAHAALAAAAEGAGAAAGRAPLRLVPDRARDLPRVPAGRLRPAGAEAAAAAGCSTRELDLVDVETASASPYSRLAALRLRRDVHVRGRHAARRAARAGAVARPRPAARAARPGGAARPARRRRGRGGRARSCAATRATPTSCTTCCACAATCVEGEYDEGFAEPLLRERRAVRVRVAGEERLIAAEDAGRYRDALGVDAARRPARRVPRGGARRAATSSCAASRAGAGRSRPREARRASAATSSRCCAQLERRGAARARRAAARRHRARVVRPRGAAAAAPRVARRAARARSSRPSRPRSPASCPAWHGIDRRATLREALVPLQALALPVALWESEVLPRRVPGYQPAQLDQLCASGEVVWVGAGLDRVARLLPRGRAGARPPAARAAARGRGARRDPRGARRGARVLVRPARRDRARGRGGAARAVGSRLGGRGHERRLDAAARRPPLRDAASRSARAAPLLAPARGTASRRRRDAGRSTDAALRRRARTARALAELLLERQGIVTRDGVRAEGIPGGYGAVYGELRALETLGVCRRGYFVEGLGGAQFALAGRGRAAARAAAARGRRARAARARRRRPGPAVRRRAAVAEARRRARRARRRRPRRPARRRGGALRRARRPLARAAARARRRVAARRRSRRSSSTSRRGGAKRLAVERFDGEPVGETEVMPLLLEAGFLAGPRRAVLRP